AFKVGPGASFNGGSVTHTFYNSFTNNGTVTSSGFLQFLPSTPVNLSFGGTAFSSTGTVRLGGTGLITLAGIAPSLGELQIANTHPSGVTAHTNLTIAAGLVVNAGCTFSAGAGLTHTLEGKISNEGVIDGQSSTVLQNGATEISGNGSTTFNHLGLSGTVFALSDFNISGNFTNNGAFDGTGATIRFTGSSASSIAGSSPPLFDSLEIAKTGSTVFSGIALSNLNEVIVSNGTFDLGAFALSETSGAGSLSVNAGSTLKIGGANSLPLFTIYILDAAGTVEYAGSGTQIIAAQNYGSLTSSSTGARTLASTPSWPEY
ncbi:MAG: hypothetical protein ABIQ35_11190, partial [Verrucomicrobiota bacterium]